MACDANRYIFRMRLCTFRPTQQHFSSEMRDMTGRKGRPLCLEHELARAEVNIALVLALGGGRALVLHVKGKIVKGQRL